MHIISKKKLRDFWSKHPGARQPLEAWFQLVRCAVWEDFNAVKTNFNHVNHYCLFVIFDICGNKYRLIAAIHYNRQKLFVRHVLTHADYLRGTWKGK